MDKKKIRILTRAAVLLALTVVFQYFGRIIPVQPPNNNFIVGPLVNACLIIATFFTGIAGGAAVAILSPFGAILTGATTPFPLLPFIALGNLALVTGVFLLKRKLMAGILAGAVIKFVLIFASITLIVPTLKIPDKQKTSLLFVFGWPQLVTALVGGIIAFIIIERIKKYIKD